MSQEKHDHPFYGVDIFSDREQEYIQNFLAKYKTEVANEDLKKKIWDDLQMEKYHGRIKIPFKVVLKKDYYGKFPDCIEVILDTKL